MHARWPSTDLGAEAAAPKATASASGEALIAADQGAVVTADASPFEAVALGLARPPLRLLCAHTRTCRVI